MIPIYKPYQAAKTKEYLSSAVDSNWFSMGGYFYEKCVEKLKDILNVKHVLLTNNGTSATHLLAKHFLNQKVSKIICPNGVYVAAWNSFLFDGKLQLEIVDADINTWNYDRQQLNSVLVNQNPQNTALLIVHNIGNPFQFHDSKFKIVEDNCEGFLGKYHTSKMTGTACEASAISFFSNKHITCGEGGAFVTNDDEIYTFAKSVHGQGVSSVKFVHDRLGTNYRMTNLSAAMLLSQLEEIDTIIERKTELFNFYRNSLKNCDEITTQVIENGCEHSNWMFGIRIKNSSYQKSSKFFELHGVETRQFFYPANMQPYLNEFIQSNRIIVHDDTNTKTLNREVIILPSYPDISIEDRQHVINVVKLFLNSLK